MKRGFLYRVVRYDDNKLLAEYDSKESAVKRADEINEMSDVQTFVVDGKGNFLYETKKIPRRHTAWYRDEDTRG